MSKILAFEKLISVLKENGQEWINYHDCKIYFPRLSSITYKAYCTQLEETGRYKTEYRPLEFGNSDNKRAYCRNVLHIKSVK
jgi:hypothetical protein